MSVNILILVGTGDGLQLANELVSSCRIQHLHFRRQEISSSFEFKGCRGNIFFEK